MTNLVIVAMVRNECDIIELFVKINSRHAKHIVIIDHLSDDGTSEILNQMLDSSSNLTIVNHSNPDFQQSKVITSIVNQLANLNIYDYIIPLDADEFLASTTLEFDLIEAIPNTLSTNGIGSILWQTYCPTSINYFEQESPLFSNFRKRSLEPIVYSKLIIGNEYAKDCIITEGNHAAISPRFGFNPIQMPFSIQHVPVRSSEQIIAKAIIGSYQLSMKKNRQIGEGFHWDLMAQQIREKKFLINEDDLKNIALNYAASNPTGATPEIDYDSPRIGNNNDNIQLIEFAKPVPLQHFDNYIKKMQKLIS
jgi:glycosyltransferase involved in cell wall biosynthesis